MSRLSSKSFLCKECNRPLCPKALSTSSEYCFETYPDDSLKKTPYVAARCECGYIGVFPRLKKAETYFKHMELDISFHIDTTRWVKDYMEDSDNFFKNK